MNRYLVVPLAQLTAHVLRVDPGEPWYSNILINSIVAGLIVGGSAGFAIALMSLVPGWNSVSLAATPTFGIASFLCATVVAVKSWSR